MSQLPVMRSGGGDCPDRNVARKPTRKGMARLIPGASTRQSPALRAMLRLGPHTVKPTHREAAHVASAAFVALEPEYFWSHVLTSQWVEKTERAAEIRVTECLWAATFRAAGAADIGYATVCHPDFAAATAFNPKMRMLRTKTLMQGHDCCNHRWVIDA